MNTDTYECINGQKPHLIKNGTRIQCNTDNFVPIVVPGLSTSSSSSFPSSTSMTPSKQEIDHPTSSSSWSTSPTMTSSSVSSKSVARQERRDPRGIDSYPGAVSNEHVERQEWGDPHSSEISEKLLTKPTKTQKKQIKMRITFENGGSSSTSRTPSRQESHCSSSSSSSSSSPTVSEIQTRERDDRIESDISPVTVSTKVHDRSEQPVVNQANKIPKTHKNENHEKDRGNPLCSEIPEWLQELRENLVPEQGDSHAICSHEVSLEPTFKSREDLGKHSVYTHFPKDRNCEICQRTKMTRAPCRRHIGVAVPRAENFGDMLTADHKVLSDNCESRNNHRYAVVVQDLATQWIQAYPCKQKLLRKPREACKSSWSPIGSLKSFTLTIPWNSAKPVKISPGIIARLHHTDQRQMEFLKEQCAE